MPNQREKVEKVAQLLEGEGHSVSTLRGGKSQDARSEALGDFKAGAVNILVATDVAARGIDVKNVTHVINFLQASPQGMSGGGYYGYYVYVPTALE